MASEWTTTDYLPPQLQPSNSPAGREFVRFHSSQSRCRDASVVAPSTIADLMLTTDLVVPAGAECCGRTLDVHVDRMLTRHDLIAVDAEDD